MRLNRASFLLLVGNVMTSTSLSGTRAAAAESNSGRIRSACETSFTEATRHDCNKFVKAVFKALGVTTPVLSDANDTANLIVDKLRAEVKSGTWAALADGVAAKSKADNGALVIAGMRSNELVPKNGTPRANGHVAVVVAGPLDTKFHLYPRGYWGQKDGSGERDRSLTKVFSSEDVKHVSYFAYEFNPIIGKWIPAPSGGMVRSAAMEFTPDQMIIRGGADPRDRLGATYVVRGNEVLVQTRGGMMGNFVCRANHDSTITCAVPLLGETVYHRAVARP